MNRRAPAAHASSPLKGTERWTLAVTAASVFMATLDAGIVNISLPTLVSALRTDFSAVQWVVVSYVLVLTALLMTAARLGDMIPKKKIFTIGVGVFTGGSLLCGLAPSVEALVTFRIVQGVGAAMAQAMGPALVTETFPAERRGRALGIIGATVSIGLALGPGLGGLLIGAAGWRAMFLINVPIGLFVSLIAVQKLPNLPSPKRGQRFDLLGALLLLLTLSAYAVAMTGGAKSTLLTPRNLALLGSAIVGLALFIRRQRRTPDPMLDLNLFRDTFFSLNLVMGFCAFITISAGFVLPFFLEIAHGLSPAQTGLIMTAQPVAMGIVAPTAGSLADKFGSRGISVVGLLVGALGCAATAALDAEAPPLSFAAATALTGIGIGLFQSPNNSAVMGAAPRNRLGAASGLLGLSRTLGHTTGVPLMGALFAAAALSGSTTSLRAVVDRPPEAVAAGIRIVYLTAAALMLFNALIAAGVWIAARRGSSGPSGA